MNRTETAFLAAVLVCMALAWFALALRPVTPCESARTEARAAWQAYTASPGVAEGVHALRMAEDRDRICTARR